MWPKKGKKAIMMAPLISFPEYTNATSFDSRPNLFSTVVKIAKNVEQHDLKEVTFLIIFATHM